MRVAAAVVLVVAIALAAAAQALEPIAVVASVHAASKSKKPVAKRKPVATPAKQLFGAAAGPAPLAARAIGFYARGCLAGARRLAVDGPAWQAMRLSRNRNWGHPQLIGLIERLAAEAKAKDGWPGLLVGDISQPRGGPMLTGHASHQVGLDADIWLTPMPDRRLSEREREDLSATSMLGKDKLSVAPDVWTPAHARLIIRAASYREVERVLVHPAIKKALCEAKDIDRAHLNKIRPYWGHHYHMHIRIGCPKGSGGCKHQPAPPADAGCGKELEHWMALLRRPPVPAVKPARPKPPLTMAQLPAACRAVLDARPGPTAEPLPGGKGTHVPAVSRAKP